MVSNENTMQKKCLPINKALQWIGVHPNDTEVARMQTLSTGPEHSKLSPLSARSAILQATLR